MTANKGQNRLEALENSLSASYLNRVIYHRLTRGDRAGLFEPLEFINQLRDLYSCATVNKHKPSVLVERLNQIDLTDEQKSFLLHYLDILFFEESVRNAFERQLHPESSTEYTLGMSYQLEIVVEWAKLQSPVDDLAKYKIPVISSIKDYLHKCKRTEGGDDLMNSLIAECVKARLRAAMQDRYNFNRVRQHLDTLPDNETKIIYLIEIKTEYLQVGATSESKSKGFDRKCDMEIAKLKGLIEIPSPRKLLALEQNNQATEGKAAAPQLGLSEKEYLILAVPAAKAIGIRGNKLTDERMAEEMDCSRRTALRYRRKYANTYNTMVRSGYEEGLTEYTSERNNT